jgi:hypothetical protein
VRRVAAFGRVGMSACRRVGMSACRHVGVSGCRGVGVSGWRRVGAVAACRRCGGVEGGGAKDYALLTSSGWSTELWINHGSVFSGEAEIQDSLGRSPRIHHKTSGSAESA